MTLHIMARSRVKNGALLLDEHVPGWAVRISQPLHMVDPCYCILGQLFGGYIRGRVDLNLSEDDRELGFDAGPGLGYNFFDTAWKEEITARCV